MSLQSHLPAQSFVVLLNCSIIIVTFQYSQCYHLSEVLCLSITVRRNFQASVIATIRQSSNAFIVIANRV